MIFGIRNQKRKKAITLCSKPTIKNLFPLYSVLVSISCIGYNYEGISKTVNRGDSHRAIPRIVPHSIAINSLL